MTNEESINTLKSLKSYYNDNSEYCEDGYVGFDSEDNEALDLAIKALEQQPCDNCVSRAYIESIVKELENICINGDEYILSLLSRIKNAPPVTTSRLKGQKPRQGHWIKVTNGRGGHECDVCHDYAPSFQSGNEYLSAFCPNCGADMREVNNEDK